MAKDWQKFILRQPKSWQIKILAVVEKILLKDLETLDIKKLKGTKHFYRCRVGKYRIIFKNSEGLIHIKRIDTRGQIYDNLNL